MSRVGQVWMNKADILTLSSGSSTLYLVVREEYSQAVGLDRFTLLDLERGTVSRCSEMAFTHLMWTRVL